MPGAHLRTALDTMAKRRGAVGTLLQCTCEVDAASYKDAWARSTLRSGAARTSLNAKQAASRGSAAEDDWR